MGLIWKLDQDGIDWDELSELYRVAPLGIKSAGLLESVFTNSMFKCFVYEGDRLVGVGRALADGSDCSYLCDLAVHPDLQGTGLGKAIMQRLIDLSAGHKKIILYANPGTKKFYGKLGFLKMNTAMAIFADPDKAIGSGLLRAAD